MSTYCDSKTQGNWNEEDTKEGTQTSKAINLVDFPQFVSSLVIDKSNHSSYDNGSQDEIGSVVKQRHEKQQSNKHCWCHYYVWDCCLCSSIVVHSRPGKWSWKDRWKSRLVWVLFSEEFLIKKSSDEKKVFFTCSHIAWRTRTSHVHEANSHHFFVAINLVISQRSKCPSHCYSFLKHV